MNSICSHLNSFLSWEDEKGILFIIVGGIYYLLQEIALLSHPSLPFLFLLVLFDFVLAAGLSFCEDCFTWAGFTRGLGKFLSYALIFIVTTISDIGMGIHGWQFNLTVAVSLYAIAGEAISCLRHIDKIFPGRLPSWVITRLSTVQKSIEMQELKADWQGNWAKAARQAQQEKSKRD